LVEILRRRSSPPHQPFHHRHGW